MDRKEELEKKRIRLAELRKQAESRKTILEKTKENPITKTEPEAGKAEEQKESILDKEETFSPNQTLDQDVPIKKEIKHPISTVMILSIDSPPKTLVTYSKEVQTKDSDEHEDVEEDEERNEEEKKKEMEMEKLRKEKKNKALLEAIHDQEIDTDIQELSNEEKKKIMDSTPFLSFLDRSTRVMERALNQPKYTSNSYEKKSNSSKNMTHACSFFYEPISNNRAITDIDWSKRHTELIACSYHSNSFSTMTENQGAVLLWNMFLPSRPEYILGSPSPVLSTRISPFHSSLIVGGTYSGQILLWDIREKNPLVQKSPLSENSHTHPVYSLEIVGTQNAHTLVSISTDGLVCTWGLDSLSKPQDSMALRRPPELSTKSGQRLDESKVDDLAITTFSFPENETTTFYVGTEDGSVYQANRFDRAGTKQGINRNVVFKGHHAPITGLKVHPSSGPIDFSDLVLTSSVDWSVQLWRVDRWTKQRGMATVKSTHSFSDHFDSVYDVDWAPSHPAVFASVDGGGKLSVWNLNKETEIPIETVQVSKHALNKVRWNQNSKHLAVAVSDGSLQIYNTGEIAIPIQNDWSTFQKTLSDFQPRTFDFDLESNK